MLSARSKHPRTVYAQFGGGFCGRLVLDGIPAGILKSTKHVGRFEWVNFLRNVVPLWRMYHVTQIKRPFSCSQDLNFFIDHNPVGHKDSNGIFGFD